MKMLHRFLLLLLLSGFAATGFAGEPASGEPESGAAAKALTAQEILDKADATLTTYNDQSLRTEITVVDSDGTEKYREMRVWQKGEMRLIKFVLPADWKGTALLALDPKTNYIYLPSYKRIRRVAAHARNQSFQGMDVSQADMALFRFGTDYAPKQMEETDTDYILELTPKPGSDVGYGKLVLTIGKDRFETKQIDYYAKDGKEKLKVEVRSDWKLYEGKHYNASLLNISSAKENHQTILKNSEYKFDQGLPDSYFTTRNLKKPLR